MAKTEDLLKDLRRVGDIVDHPPTVKDVCVHGEYSPAAYVAEFEGWNAALQDAGFDVEYSPYTLDEADLLADLHRVADIIGHPPKTEEQKAHGEYPTKAYYSRFDTWWEVLDAAGFDPSSAPRPVPADALRTELKRVADKIGYPPRKADIEKHARYSYNTVRRHYGSLEDALVEAGLDPEDRPSSREIPREELLEEIRRLASELDHPPTLKEYREHGDHSATTYFNRFGSWRAAVEEAGFEPTQPQTEIPEEELLAELRRVRDVLGEEPTDSQMNDEGKYWVSTYKNHFGSWAAAKQAAFEIQGELDE